MDAQQGDKEESNKENLFSEIFSKRSFSCDNEVDQYFSEPVLPEDNDPITFWIDNKTRFKNLSRMALDYLAIPATSAPSECAFSTASNLITV